MNIFLLDISFGINMCNNSIVIFSLAFNVSDHPIQLT